MEATKHIVQDKAGFVESRHYSVGSQAIVLGFGMEEDVLGVGMYQLKLHGGNKLILHDALYAPSVRCFLISFVSLMRMGFSFGFHIDNLDLFYNGDLFGHATLKGDFIVLDLGNPMIIHLLFLFYSLTLILNLLNSMLDLAMGA